MFESLSERLTRASKTLTGRGRITPDNVKDTARQIRMALLEADVALPVARAFVDRVQGRALGEEVAGSLNPGQTFVKIVHDELVNLLGAPGEAALSLRGQRPVVIMLVGLQGAGKTTTAGKLCRYLKGQKHSVMLASTDIYRPAAIDQLQRLAEQVEAPFFAPPEGADAVSIADEARQAAARSGVDVLILDTAGRLHVDKDMMSEVGAIHARLNPLETLFIVDSMIGQDAVNAAQSFNTLLPLTGVILTKVDGDARGGAALSIREVTGRPIKFVGAGEKLDALEPFDPQRMAGRILGMGDVVSLVEQVQGQVDQDKAEKLAAKVRKGQGLNLVDLKDQLEQMLDMGGLEAILAKLPAGVAKGAAAMTDDRPIRRQIALINAMTPRERRYPKIISGSRKRRIAAGSGLAVQDVNRLLKQHQQMGKMMKRMGKGGLKGMLGQIPKGFRGR
jgi:signal recognition particle subunit SRP54